MSLTTEPGAYHAVTHISAPVINYGAMAPLLILFGVACVGVLVEAFVPSHLRHITQVWLALAGLAASLVAVIMRAPSAITTAARAVSVDSAGLFLQGTIVVLGAVSILLIAERRLEPGGAFVTQGAVLGTGGAVVAGVPARAGGTTTGAGATGAATSTTARPSTANMPMQPPSRTEIFPLTIFALAGMMLFVTANDLLLMFVALEVLSLPLYLLCGLARRRRLLSQEAAVKYFLLGAFASAFFLYGVALLYGYAGTVRLSGIHDAVQRGDGSTAVLLLGIALLVVGLLFKAGAAPFHQWTPDVYQGAPTSITALMAACTKVAAFGAILRVLFVAFSGAKTDWRPALIGVAIITMLVGSVLSVTQTDIKRLLAYSSIANAGFILTGATALTKSGLSSTLFYLSAYGFTIIGAFAVVMLVRDADGEATHLSRWTGLGRRSPLLAGVMTLFLLSFAGIPLTSGFTSKFAVFSAALGGGSTTLVIVGVITSMIIAFPYLRLVVLMYLSEPVAGGAAVQVPGAFTSVAIALGVVATLVLGLAPEPLLNLAENAARFVS